MFIQEENDETEELSNFWECDICEKRVDAGDERDCAEYESLKSKGFDVIEIGSSRGYQYDLCPECLGKLKRQLKIDYEV